MRAWIGVGAVVWSGAALAEPLQLHINEYQPMVNTKAGRIDMCGAHFSSVVTTMNGRILNIQGSLMSSYFPGKVPGTVIKVNVREIRKDKTVFQYKTHHASMRAGALDTSRMKAAPGEDGNSILLMTNMNETGEFFIEFPEAFYTGAWLSVSIDPKQGDYTYRLPAFGDKDLDTSSQIAQCTLSALDTLQKEMGVKP